MTRVTIGTMLFFSTCFHRMTRSGAPKARAVRTWSLPYSSTNSAR